MTDDTSTRDVPSGAWGLWRQDDNGNRFRIARFGTRESAEAEQRRFEALGHKQTYWVERAPPEGGGAAG
jgi:hypothetical protein